MGVGDLTIRGVQGRQDVHTGVGDLRLGRGRSGRIRPWETRTRIGDVHDVLQTRRQPVGRILGHTEDFSLSGRYHLRRSTSIGDVRAERRAVLTGPLANRPFHGKIRGLQERS